MNAATHRNICQDEYIKTRLQEFPLTNDQVSFEAEFNDSTEQIVVECEMIWLQVNQ